MSFHWPIELCPKCKGKRMPFDGPHAPHWVTRHGQAVLVDCKQHPISTQHQPKEP